MAEPLIECIDVAIQSGTYDCGLYAVAFATALALGEKPELFFFDQSKMWEHLWRCLERGEMQMFPVLRKHSVKKSSVKEVAVYCKCRMPCDHMIECTKCKEWFHIDTCVCAPPSYIRILTIV